MKLRAALFALLLATAACGGSSAAVKSGPSCTILPIEIYVQPGPDLNPNEKGQSEPVEVRALLLKDRLTLDRLPYDVVYGGKDKALAADIIKSYSMTVFPGRDEILPISAPMNVSFVAILGVFRSPTDDSWKYVFDVTDLARRCTPGGLHVTLHSLIRRCSILPGQ
jgi:type VI secretion system VasD/TssJ family lipoprotein